LHTIEKLKHIVYSLFIVPVPFDIFLTVGHKIMTWNLQKIIVLTYNMDKSLCKHHIYDVKPKIWVTVSLSILAKWIHGTMLIV
jgi:hypothetical protein